MVTKIDTMRFTSNPGEEKIPAIFIKGIWYYKLGYRYVYPDLSPFVICSELQWSKLQWSKLNEKMHQVPS